MSILRLPALGFAILLAILFAWSSPTVSAREHPFLICKKSEFDELRARAEKSPWREFRKQGIRVFETQKVSVKDHVGSVGYHIRNAMGAAGLVYVIEPDRRGEACEKGMAVLRLWRDFLPAMDDFWNNNKKRWYATVPPSSAFFQSVIFLDVVHDDLSAEDLAEAESLLGAAAEWYWAKMRGWEMATTGPRALWAIYQNDTKRLDRALRDYRAHIFANITDSGVFYGGPEYATGRLGGERTAKFGVMHVAEYTGLDRYYDNPSVQGFYEWLYSAGYAPNGSCVTFGDAGHGRGFTTLNPMTMAWAASEFSEKAAGYAANRMAVKRPGSPTDLLSYCIVRQPVPEPITPPSRVWPDGMAMFRERDGSREALMGALWNLTKTASHAHQDANAIYIAGYGDALLLNSGYKGYGTGLGDFSWDYVSNNPVSSNMLMLDGAKLATKAGDGIGEQMLAGYVDWATGLNDKGHPGPARHLRTFSFVHPDGETPGYFVAFDEVRDATGHKEANLAFHPASADVRAVVAGREYEWKIRLQQDRDTFLSVALASAPAGDPELREGLLAGWRESFFGKYLYASFALPVDGDLALATVLFPHNAEHAKAAMERLEAGGASAMRLTHPSGAVDVVAVSLGDREIGLGGATFRGASVIWRSGNGEGFYVARKATRLAAGDVGFDASAPVDVAWRKGEATVRCSGKTDLTLRDASGAREFSLDAGLHRLP